MDWKRLTIGAFFLLATFARAETESAERKNLTVGETGDRIAAFARSAMKGGFQGSILAARDGKVVAALGIGNANSRLGNTPATLFEIASVTKQITAAAALKLVDAGKLDLDASIAKYLPGIPDSCRKITTRHLLQHTSGIPGTNSQGAGTDLARVLPSFLHGGPRHEPGTHWEYWNQGYALASEIIARVSGQSYVDFCREALFRPAGMRVSCFTGDEPPEGAVESIGQSTRGAPRYALEHPYRDYGFQYRGMGGVVTSVWDLWRWHRALNGDLLSAKAKAEVFKPGPRDYALGWFVRKNRSGRLCQSHGGGVRGFVCEVRRFPNENACVFVLANRDDAPVREVANGVEQLLFGEKLTVTFAKAAEPDLAKKMAGTYVDQRGNRMTIVKRGKKLLARIDWKAGMVSRMTIGRNKKGEVVAVQGGKPYVIKSMLDIEGKTRSFTMLTAKFTRKE